ncbi:MAG: carbon dioxide concentrating mechanism protein [Cyanobacteria bacterium P01_F01_bin.13]
MSHTHYYRGGDVVVDASAAIAPGVVFRAAPNGAIRIGPGVCIGAGVVIQAKQGCVFVEAGVSLGTGVLIVGHGHVGKDTCVGPSSTLINPAIAPNTILPPCSLSEGRSTQLPASAGDAQSTASSFQSPNFHTNNSAVPSMDMPPRTSPTVQPQAVSPKAVNVPNVEPVPPPTPPEATSAITAPNNGHVYGRDHLNNLLSALFPHRQPLNNGNSSGESEKEA